MQYIDNGQQLPAKEAMEVDQLCCVQKIVAPSKIQALDGTFSLQSYQIMCIWAVRNTKVGKWLNLVFEGSYYVDS